jgi:glycosyltransferase involved in cell wall biosynthesis
MEKPLVSVIIATYNSDPFIVETLESIKTQTYNNIELIITDDASKDKTIEICRQWIRQNQLRFIYTQVVTTAYNTGVSANTNRGLHAAKGEWVKFFGADDTLKANCIDDNISHVAAHPEIKALFLKVEVYKDTFKGDNLIKIIPGNALHCNSIMAPGRTAESQYKMLLISDRIHFSPSVFLHRETLLSIGGFDERFRMMEDYPLWLNLTRNGNKLYFMDKPTVNYRQHSRAINNTPKDYLIKPNYFRTEGFRRIYTYPNLPWDIRMNARFGWYASQVFRCDWLNRNKKPNRLLLALLTTWLNPFRYIIYLRKRVNKKLINNEFYM